MKNVNGIYYSDNCVAYAKPDVKIAIIQDGAEKILPYAFCGCEDLKEIYIPATVKSIGECAFYGVNNLDKITVESGNACYKSVNGCLLEIKTKTLIKGTGIADIPDGENVVKIGEAAFFNRKGLKTVTIPETVKIIEKDAFSGSGLNEIYIPNSVKRIGDGAFFGCEFLKKAHIPENMKEIPTWAFSRCDALQGIDFPKSLKKIGNYAFAGCESLSFITLTKNVEEVGRYAFCSCKNVTEIILDNKLKSIGEYAFYGCKRLKKVFYEGNKEHFKDIEIGVYNSRFNLAERYFYEEYSKDGWRYVDNSPVPWENVD